MNPNILIVLTLISLKSTNLQVIKQVGVPVETLPTLSTSTTTQFPFEVIEYKIE
jgi:hypothetical protein